MPNLTWITKKYFPQLSPRQINLGNCYNWAYTAYKNYNNARLFTVEEYGGHAFIKIGQKYFDAESPMGEQHWSNLEFFRGVYSPIIPHKQSLNEFISYWSREGKHPIFGQSYDRHI